MIKLLICIGYKPIKLDPDAPVYQKIHLVVPGKKFNWKYFESRPQYWEPVYLTPPIGY